MDKARRINDPNALTDGLVWVLLRYKDGSEFCFQTTLNQDILREHGVILEEDCLVRLDKKYFVKGAMVYRQFRYQCAVVSLWDSMHYEDPLSEQLKDLL